MSLDFIKITVGAMFLLIKDCLQLIIN